MDPRTLDWAERRRRRRQNIRRTWSSGGVQLHERLK